MSSQVLLIATLALAALLLASLVLLVGHGTWRALADAYWRRPIVDARRALAETADRLELSDAGAKALGRLPARRRIDVFVELAHSVAGAPQLAIADAARRLGVITSAERSCASRRWRRRLRGARLLTTIGGGEEAVPPLLGDPRPEVRAQAAEWAAGHPDPELVAALTGILGDPRGLARFTVMDSLIRLGAHAVEPLCRTIYDATGVTAVSALRVGTMIGDPRLVGPARARIDDADPAVRAWAVRLVGSVGGDENAAAVEERLSDPAPEVRAAAALALGRLGHWMAAGRLGARLGDPAWEVRRNAALALRSFGSPGELLLNRALRDEDPFARDMARQTLDLPEITLPV